MRKRWYWIVLIAVLLLATATVAGAQDGLTVLEQHHSYAFNEELVFELSLESGEPIPAGNVQLLYNVGHDSDVVNRRQPDYEPGQSLSLRIRDELDQGEIPPASTITYHWKITNAAGDTFETDEQSFTYMDDRFDWQSKTEEPITIYWYGRVDGPHLLDVAVQALTRLEQTIDYELKMPINIVVYQNRRDMQGATAPRGESFDEQITLLGVVVAPDIMLLLSATDVENTIGHELTHMVVGAATENPFADIPTWLNEGLAMYNQDYVEQRYRAVLQDAVDSNDLDTVRRLSGRTGNPARVNLWYAEVWSVVDFLISQYGEDKVAELLDIFSDGAHPDDALMEVYGFDRDGLTARWWKWLGANVPPALQSELEGEAETADGQESQAPAAREAPTQESAPESQLAQEPEPEDEPAGGLGCVLGLLPLGLILFGALQFRRRAG